ncbi:hypothetical protein ACQPYE_08175 [Actinosynnema sp. CA-299493]
MGVVEALAHPCRAVRRLLALAETWPEVRDDTGTDAPYRTMRPLRPQEIDALVEAYEAGAGVKTLAERFGVHRATVGRHLHSRGIDTTPPALTAAQVKTAAELYQQGWSLMKIARRFDVNDGTVWRKLKAAGVRMRPATNAEWMEKRKTT